MRWGLLLATALAAPIGAVVYACSPDTFVTITANDFCDAESAFYTRCGDTRTCTQKNLTNCGPAFGDLNPQLTKAFVDCQSTIPCGTSSFYLSLDESTCLTNELEGGLTSPAITKLAQDVCTQCVPADLETVDAGNARALCVADFSLLNPPGVGFLAAFFNDTIVGEIDQACTGASADKGDGSIGSCATVFLICTGNTAAQHSPPDFCAVDAGAD